MISVSDALSIILDHTLVLPTETIPLTEATGRVLREPIVADRDFPPFNRVTMDGIAIAFSAYGNGQRSFAIEGTQFAGQPQQALNESTACWEVMTGAMLPLGADTVVRYEDLTIADGQATIQIESVQAGQNVHRQGVDRQQGDVLIQPGTQLRPAEIAVAVTVGKAQVQVTARPRIALISTGDELVGIHETPLPYQIRQSNTWMMQAVFQTLGIEASLHHIVDNEQVLTEKLATLLANNDIVVLSGGVSAGKADFVPDTLTKLGVQCHFHQVAQRPGKPLWFGSTANDQKTVFALPGNPVSTTMCVYRYILPYVHVSLSGTPMPAHYAQLAEPVTFRPPLTYFLPVKLSQDKHGMLSAKPLPGSGSGDFANLMAADGFLELPANQSDFAQGESFVVWPFVR